MDLEKLRGTGTALVTPFREDGSLDDVRFVAHVRAQLQGGVEFLVPCGTTGESATMSGEEQRRVITLAVECAAGKVPVVAGAGGNDTAKVVGMARAARDAGADAILSVSPYYNKPSPAGLLGHYQAVAGAVDIPVIVYNVPGRTGSNIEVDTLLRIAEIENVVGVKEASGRMGQIMEIIARRPEGFLVLSGDDALTLPMVAAGADGVISVVANQAPALMSRMVRAVLSGELAEAREIHYRLLPLMNANFLQGNPIPVKTGLEMMGRGPAYFRLPLAPLDPQYREPLRMALQEAGLLP